MQRILFVDDDPAILRSLRRIVSGKRQQWEPLFAASGEEALTTLATTSFDVVVSDVTMPGMGGIALLRRVRELYPGSVRVVLTGLADDATSRSLAEVAHQFITKPFETSTLMDMLDRVTRVAAGMRSDELRQLIGGTAGLVSSAPVFAELNRCLAARGAAASDVSAIVGRDPALAAKVLQLVNSAFFGLSERVVSVQRAVILLGVNTVRYLALSSEVFRAFRGDPVPGFSVEALQNEGFLAARIARAIAAPHADGDEAFAAALLHDVGLLVLASQRVELLAEVLGAAARRTSEPLEVIEREYLKMTHAEIGACLLGLWGLPAPIVDAIAMHHVPSPERGLDLAAVVYVACALSSEVTPFEGAPRLASTSLDPELLRAWGAEDRVPRWRTTAAAIAGGPTVNI